MRCSCCNEIVEVLVDNPNDLCLECFVSLEIEAGRIMEMDDGQLISIEDWEAIKDAEYEEAEADYQSIIRDTNYDRM